jgi:hypothetical protein
MEELRQIRSAIASPPEMRARHKHDGLRRARYPSSHWVLSIQPANIVASGAEPSGQTASAPRGPPTISWPTSGRCTDKKPAVARLIAPPFIPLEIGNRCRHPPLRPRADIYRCEVTAVSTAIPMAIRPIRRHPPPTGNTVLATCRRGLQPDFAARLSFTF